MWHCTSQHDPTVYSGWRTCGISIASCPSTLPLSCNSKSLGKNLEAKESGSYHCIKSSYIYGIQPRFLPENSVMYRVNWENYNMIMRNNLGLFPRSWPYLSLIEVQFETLCLGEVVSDIALPLRLYLPVPRNQLTRGLRHLHLETAGIQPNRDMYRVTNE